MARVGRLVRRTVPARDRPRLVVVLVAAAVAAPLVGAALVGRASPALELAMSSGSAWVSTPAQGLVTLIDGSSEQVVTSVRVAVAAGDTRVTQAGTSAYLADVAAGTVTHVDGATFEASAPVLLGTPEGDVSVLRGGRAVYVLDPARRTASRVDPRDLRIQDTVSLAARPGAGQAVVDPGGRLWVVDGDDGGLTWFDGDRSGTVPGIDPRARVVLVQERPVLVDVGAGQITPLRRDGSPGARSCLDVRADDSVQLLGSQSSDEVFAAVAGTGTVVIAATTGDDCRRVVEVADPGDNDFGPLAQSGRYLFVPDRASGTTTVVDTRQAVVVGRFTLAEPGHRVDLLGSQGLVFYNDRDGHTAGVLTLHGTRWSAGEALDKFDPTTGAVPGVEGGSAPAGPAPAPIPDEPVVPPSAPAPNAPDALPVPAAPAPASPAPAPPAALSTPRPGDAPTSPSGPNAAPLPVPSPPPGTAPAPGPGTTPPTPPPSTPTPDPAPVVTSLTADAERYAPYSDASVTATVENADGATWTWSLTRDGTDVPVTQPAPGAPLVVTVEDVGTYAVTLTLARGPLTGAATTDLVVESSCGMREGPPLDLRTSSEGLLQVAVDESCFGTVEVMLTLPPWLSAPDGPVVSASQTRPSYVTVRLVGSPPTDGENVDAVQARLVQETTSGTPQVAYSVLVNVPPEDLGSGSCLATGSTVWFYAYFRDGDPAALDVRLTVGGVTYPMAWGGGAHSLYAVELAPAVLGGGDSWTVQATDSGGLTSPVAVWTDEWDCW